MVNKIIFAFLLILTLSGFSFSQDCYTVLKVKGKIVLEKTGAQIKTNDEICSNDNLIFYSSDAVAVVHSVTKGRFTVKAVSGTGNELNDIVKSTLASVLSSGKSNLSTKGIEDSEPESKMPYFVVGNFTFRIDIKRYPINDDKYFCLKFNSEGTHLSKLNNAGDTLILNKESILNIDGKMLSDTKLDSAKLIYFDKTSGTQTQISEFSILFADENLLKDELNNYINVLKKQNLSNNQILSEILDYVSETYGQTDSKNFLNWIKSNLDL